MKNFNNGKMPCVANYFRQTGKLKYRDVTLVWPGGSLKAPLGRPECGFNNELCPAPGKKKAFNHHDAKVPCQDIKMLGLIQLTEFDPKRYARARHRKFGNVHLHTHNSWQKGLVSRSKLISQKTLTIQPCATKLKETIMGRISFDLTCVGQSIDEELGLLGCHVSCSLTELDPNESANHRKFWKCSF